MSNIYSQKVIDHFRQPHNMGSIKDPDGVGEVGNPACGDIMKLYIKVGKNKKGEKKITDISFETMGCAAAVATSSMITDLALGKTLTEAIKITNKDVAAELDGLPPIKMHCSNLAASALKKAIENYQQNQEL